MSKIAILPDVTQVERRTSSITSTHDDFHRWIDWFIGDVQFYIRMGQYSSF